MPQMSTKQALEALRSLCSEYSTDRYETQQELSYHRATQASPNNNWLREKELEVNALIKYESALLIAIGVLDGK